MTTSTVSTTSTNEKPEPPNKKHISRNTNFIQNYHDVEQPEYANQPPEAIETPDIHMKLLNHDIARPKQLILMMILTCRQPDLILTNVRWQDTVSQHLE